MKFLQIVFLTLALCSCAQMSPISGELNGQKVESILAEQRAAFDKLSPVMKKQLIQEIQLQQASSANSQSPISAEQRAAFDRLSPVMKKELAQEIQLQVASSVDPSNKISPEMRSNIMNTIQEKQSLNLEASLRSVNAQENVNSRKSRSVEESPLMRKEANQMRSMDHEMTKVNDELKLVEREHVMGKEEMKHLKLEADAEVNQMRSMEEETKKLQREIENLKINAPVTRTKRIADESQLEKVHDQSVAMKKETSEMRSMEKEMTAEENQIHNIEAQHLTHETDMKRLADKVVREEVEMMPLKADLDTMKRDVEMLNQILKKVERKTRSTVDEQNPTMKKEVDEMKTMEREMNTEEQQIKSISAENSAEKVDMKRLTNEVQKAESAINPIKSNMNNLKREIEDLKNKLFNDMDVVNSKREQDSKATIVKIISRELLHDEQVMAQVNSIQDTLLDREQNLMKVLREIQSTQTQTTTTPQMITTTVSPL